MLLLLPLTRGHQLIAAERFPGLKKGAIYQYDGYLKTTTLVTHKIKLSIEILDVSKSAVIHYNARVLFEIEDLRYGHEGEKFVQNLEVQGDISEDDLYKTIATLNWTKIIDFNPPIDVTTFFDTSDIKGIDTYWTETVYQEKILERPPIYKKSWDIILGNYRRIIYMEIYTAKWLVIGENNYLTELDLSIDEELGIVSKMRLFYPKAGVSYELKMELANTNMMPKNTLIMYIGAVIIAILAVSIIMHRYKEKIFRRKIPIPE